MKSGSISGHRAGKQMFETKIFKNFSSLETGCELCLQRLSYKSTEKLFEEDKAQKPKFIFENENFRNI